MSMNLRSKMASRKQNSMRGNRQDEARRQIRNALQHWQDACDAWLAAKSRSCSKKDSEAIRRERALKSLIDAAADELKQALQTANAV